MSHFVPHADSPAPKQARHAGPRIWQRLFLFSSVVLASWVFFIGTKPAIDKAHFDRIRPGMSQQDLALMLGHPPGSFVSGNTQYEGIAWVVFRWGPLPSVQDGIPRERRLEDRWFGDHGAIWVTYDIDGRVADKVFYPVKSGAGLLAKLRLLCLEWLGV